MADPDIQFAIWYAVIGALLIAVMLSGTFLERLPLSLSMVYLAAGLALGPAGAGLIGLDPLEHAGFLERACEAAVIISLFTAGLKLRAPLSEPLWRIPFRLAFVSMAITVGLIALLGTALLGLPPGPAIVLGAILAPTDPVLAAGVHLKSPLDRDRLRFSLTGEASLNDGTAFPFLILGLALCKEGGPGAWLGRWALVDGVWAVGGGLAIGGALGHLVAALVLRLRRERRTAVGLDDFLALGLLLLTYGTALLAGTYGFLAVLAAGLSLRRIEMRSTEKIAGGEEPPELPEVLRPGQVAEMATHHEKGPAFLVQAVMGFNEALERIAEVAVVLLLGGMLHRVELEPGLAVFLGILFLVVRPLSIALGLLGAEASRPQKALLAWFGIRGIGSIYYLAYAIRHGLPPEAAGEMASLVLASVAASIVLHGVSVTPLMGLYERMFQRGRQGEE